MKVFYVCVALGCILFSFGLCSDTAKSDKSATTALTKKFGDENVVYSLVKGLMEFASNGFKTGLEASVRSIFNKPVTTAVYALSMLVGVVAMLAFYESPISPLPVPPLPDPPVGRFPPEHPVWPPPASNARNQGPGLPMQQYNNKRAGFGPHTFVVPNAPAGMANANYFPYGNDNHRSDQNRVMRPKIPLPNHLNETSYNNYISKLTSTLDLNNNNPNGAAHVMEQLKHAYSSSSELTNKVIDYNNKRMAVESLKFSNNNQTVS